MNYRVVILNVVIAMVVAAIGAYYYGEYKRGMEEIGRLRESMKLPQHSPTESVAPTEKVVVRELAMMDSDALARAEKAEADLAELQLKYDALILKLDEKRQQKNTSTDSDASLKKQQRFTPEFQEDLSQAKRVYVEINSERYTQERYGQFLEQLDGDTAARAREALHQILTAMKPSADGYFEQVRENLASVLSRDQMAALIEYETYVPEMMMRRQHDVEIALLAPDLPIESRNIVVDSLIANVLPIKEDGQGRPIHDVITDQIHALGASAAALHGLLPESEVSAATAYIHTQMQILETERVFMEAKKPVEKRAD